VRGFKDQPVSRKFWNACCPPRLGPPSGSNIQPWNIYVLTGAPLVELTTRAVERVATATPGTSGNTRCIRPRLGPHTASVDLTFGKERYSALGIARDDWEARQRAPSPTELFGAPAALFLLHRSRPGPAQWGRRRHVFADIMLLPAAKDCTVARRWRGRRFARQSAEVLSPPDGLVLFCVCQLGTKIHGDLRPYGPRPA